jgi:fructokinase
MADEDAASGTARGEGEPGQGVEGDGIVSEQGGVNVEQRLAFRGRAHSAETVRAGESHRWRRRGGLVNELYGGVETGGTWCVCAVARGQGEIVAEAQFPTRDPTSTLAEIVAFFRDKPGLRAVGIGSFGPVDLNPASPTWGHVMTTPKLKWRRAAVAPVIRDELDVPVAFDTDVNAAALAEHRWGAGRGVDSLCYLTVGTGIGAGLLVNGRPWHGLVHSEAGHMRVPHDRERDPFPGSCPVHGDCWEGLAAGSALAARWQRAPDQLSDEHPAWSLEAEYLALGIVNLIMVFSPQRVIVGGGVLEHPTLLDMTRGRVPEIVAGYLNPPELGPEIGSYLVSPQLGDRAGVLGAVALAQDL